MARHRECLDPGALLGIPAHITVLFPFIPPETVDPVALAELEHVFAAASRFSFQLDHTGWFREEVLWLAPRDPGPFRALTRRVYQAFPAFPPFGGQFGDVVPHLTVGTAGPGRLVHDLRAAEETVRGHLPIGGQATAVTWMTQPPAAGQWAKAATFTLA